MVEKIYKIHIKNHLDDRWVEWFQAERIEYLEDGITALVVRVPDQPALHGLLERIRDLNLTLISVNELGPLFEQDSSNTEEYNA